MTDAGGPPPRVLFAVGSLDRGGSENQLFELIEHAHGRHLEAALLTFSPADAADREARLAELGVRHVHLGPLGGPRSLRPFVALPRIVKQVRGIAPDVIYPWLEAPATSLAPVARALGIPLVIARRNVCGANVERYPPVRAAIL